MNGIEYKVNALITLDDFLKVLKSSGLAERRPVEDLDCLQSMLDNSNLIVSAWFQGEIIGISRSVTDFSYCCYISDLAVDKSYQRMGIGIKLQQLTQEATGERCKVILRAAPDAMAYYPKIGYAKCENAFIIYKSEAIGS